MRLWRSKRWERNKTSFIISLFVGNCDRLGNLAPFLEFVISGKFDGNLANKLIKSGVKFPLVFPPKFKFKFVQKFRKSQAKITKCGAINYFSLIFLIFAKIWI